MGNLKGNIPWNKGKTKENDASVKKISDTMKKMKIDNFAKWRNEAKNQGVIPSSERRLSKSREQAFLIGLILGDWNISRFPITECFRLTL